MGNRVMLRKTYQGMYGGSVQNKVKMFRSGLSYRLEG